MHNFRNLFSTKREKTYCEQVYEKVSSISFSNGGDEVFGMGQFRVGDRVDKQNKTILLINLVAALKDDSILFANVGSTFRNICQSNPQLLKYINETSFDNKTIFYKHLENPAENIFNNICVVCCGDGTRNLATIKLYPDEPEKNSKCLLLFDSNPGDEKSFKTLSILHGWPDTNSRMQVKFSTEELENILKFYTHQAERA